MPNISFEDWKGLKIYLTYPLTSEQNATVDDFIDKVYNKEHQTLAWRAFLQILQEGGVVSIEEKVFAHELQSSLKESTGKFLRKLKYFFLHTQTKSKVNAKKKQESQTLRIYLRSKISKR